MGTRSVELRRPAEEPPRRLERWAVAALAAAFVLHATLAYALRLYVDDEGLLTYFFGAWTWDEPLATLFFQKSRPTLGMLYALPGELGLVAFTAAHALVATAALPLTASIARHVGVRRPWLAAAIVATSPLMLAGSVAGVSNTDAVTGGALAVWLLHVRRRPAAAGVVVALLLFARSEMLLLAGTLAVTGGPERGDRWRMLVAASGIVSIYFALGALYHHDLTWMFRYPPALTSVNPAVSGRAAADYAGSLKDLLVGLLALSPAVILVLASRWKGVTRVERASLLFVVVFIVALRGLPLVGVFNFDASPRYLLPALPFVAVLAVRALERLTSSEPLPKVLGIVLPTLLLSALVTMQSTRMVTGRDVRAVAAELSNMRDVDVITNMQTLRTVLVLGGRDDGERVHYLLQADQRHELERLTNPAVEQREALFGAMNETFYGHPLSVEVLRPEDVSAGTVFALEADERLDTVMPEGTWKPWLENVAQGRSWTVARRRESPQPRDEHGP